MGSVGKEISDTLRPAEWVKTIDTSGDVSNIDWGPIYQVQPAELHQFVSWVSACRC